MKDISVGVIAHNEETNIKGLLDSVLNQRLSYFGIKEIIVVSSGSTDRTDDIVSERAEKDLNIRLIREPERKGKYSAVNIFLKEARTDIVVMISGDVIPKKDSIERLCKPLLNPRTGISGAHPVTKARKDNLTGYCAWLEWKLHHLVSLKKPKFGEMIAFRRVFSEIPPTAVDEEEIAKIVREKGFRGKYVPSAIVYNSPPEKLSELIEQRRRIYAGQLALKEKGYKVTTLDIFAILQIIKNVPNQRVLWTWGAIILEGLSRFLGSWDHHVLKKSHHIWELPDKKSTHEKDISYNDITVVIPTLNEEKNIKELLNLITKEYPGIKILVIDEDSEDRTQEIVKAQTFKNKNVELFVRRDPEVRGLTASLLEGIQKAESRYLIVMDGDLQHPPEKIKDIAHNLPEYDLVVGRRERVLRWSLKRRLMSSGANFLAHVRLSLKRTKCSDLMSGFFGGKTRIFKDVLKSHENKFVKEGYKFLFEFFKFNKKRLKVKEFAYNFGMRTKGNSKIGPKEIKAFVRSLLR